MNARLVLTTVGSPASADNLAHVLLEKRLCACVSILPRITSLYWWNGAVTEDNETQLVIKTKDALIPELEQEIVANHPYQVPEIIVLEPQYVSAAYLKWLVSETREPIA